LIRLLEVDSLRTNGEKPRRVSSLDQRTKGWLERRKSEGWRRGDGTEDVPNLGDEIVELVEAERAEEDGSGPDGGEIGRAEESVKR
jgi:hypothetical protein